MLHAAVTDAVLGAFYRVYNALGYGFLEKVYQNALGYELSCMGFRVATQQPLKVFYRDILVGECFADLVVDGKVILELKAAEALRDEHVAQLTNYVKATDVELGLLLNFGKKPEFRRIVFSNGRFTADHGSSAAGRPQ